MFIFRAPSADLYAPGTLLHTCRARRFATFQNSVKHLRRPLRIIDIGGTTAFWEMHGWAGRRDVDITLVNLSPERQRHDNIHTKVADATDLAFADDYSFDIAFSNSTIEHLYTIENQARMAREIRRVAPSYWVQTPNYWFPVEPHFQFVGWQWLPVRTRIWLIQRRRFGWRGPITNSQDARRAVTEIRLLDRTALRHLFPDAHLLAETFCGLVKSWTAARVFPGVNPFTSSIDMLSTFDPQTRSPSFPA